nr:MAG TPA: hypothetical protein [Caudoviricetes sp.]
MTCLVHANKKAPSHAGHILITENRSLFQEPVSFMR